MTQNSYSDMAIGDSYAAYIRSLGWLVDLE